MTSHADGSIDSKCGIWPDDNLYLRIGLHSKIIDSHYNFLSCKLIFVDFSHNNLKLFVDSGWVEKLASTGSGLILLSDYKMDSLASYWWKQHENIATVIYSNDDKHTIKRKVKDVFIGRWLKDIQPRALTPLEFTVLNLLITAHSVNDIVQKLDLNKKKFYNTKYSLQKKMSVEINKLCICSSML